MTAKTVTAALLAAGLLLAPGGIAAQEDGDPAPLTCWRGHPLPDCRGFFVVEAQGSFPLASTSRSIRLFGGSAYESRSFESQLDWNLGFMANTSERWAVGGVLTLGTGSSDPLTGLKARVRRWIESELSLEAQAGALLTTANGTAPEGPLWGATADVRLNLGDHGSFFVRWDGVDVPPRSGPSDYFDPGGFEQAVYVGAGAGHTWAVVGTGVGFAVLFFLLSQVEWS